jgi:hypothetical protein
MVTGGYMTLETPPSYPKIPTPLSSPKWELIPIEHPNYSSTMKKPHTMEELMSGHSAYSSMNSSFNDTLSTIEKMTNNTLANSTGKHSSNNGLIYPNSPKLNPKFANSFPTVSIKTHKTDIFPTNSSNYPYFIN